jgi:DNA mismatch endonuclease, patch repair protein
MRRIRSKDTRPEMEVRALLRALGFPGYRLHREDLPGKPDIVYVGRRKAIQIHGCFWHGHTCPVGLREPRTNQSYWLPKIARTRARDAQQLAALMEQGWATLIVWECELRNTANLVLKLAAFIE